VGLNGAADLHGNTEYCSFVNCRIAGLSIGGNHHDIRGCIVGQPRLRGVAPDEGSGGNGIVLAEVNGTDWNIVNNDIYKVDVSTATYMLYAPITASTTAGGIFRFCDNKMYSLVDWTYGDSTANAPAVYFVNTGYADSNWSLDFSGNTLYAPDYSFRSAMYFYNTPATPAYGSARILNINGNTLIGGGLYVYNISPRTTITNNTIKAAPFEGIYLQQDGLATVSADVVSDNRVGPCIGQGLSMIASSTTPSGSRLGRGYVRNNTFLETNLEANIGDGEWVVGVAYYNIILSNDNSVWGTGAYASGPYNFRGINYLTENNNFSNSGVATYNSVLSVQGIDLGNQLSLRVDDSIKRYANIALQASQAVALADIFNGIVLQRGRLTIESTSGVLFTGVAHVAGSDDVAVIAEDIDGKMDTASGSGNLNIISDGGSVYTIQNGLGTAVTLCIEYYGAL